MRLIVAGLVGVLALSGVAYAQSADSTGYIEGVAQAAFGNVTSQSYGLEGGVTVAPNLALFAEFGYTRDTAPSTLGDSAQVIAGALGSGATYSVRQPTTFGIVGVRYTIPYSATLQPYVNGGLGLGRINRDVTFSVGGSDVTDNLGSYGVTLGTDLAGDETKFMINFGGGVVWNFASTWLFDLGYRYGRIFTDPSGTSINRFGAGIGFRF